MDQGARRTIIALSFLAVGLLIALVVAVGRLRSGGSFGQQSFTTQDEERAAIQELVSQGAGIYDSHPDGDVGRVLQPELEGRDYDGTSVTSNRLGMREKQWRKSDPDKLRVLLVGDSFVFGLGVGSEDRAGVFLERFLDERSPADLSVEVLHIGIASWNLQAECAWVRRSLQWTRPDLVVQLVLPNDLSDTRGVRGFGSKGRYSPQVRSRANGLVDTWTRSSSLKRNVQNHLPFGLDWESRHRYSLSSERIGGLARAVERAGGRYLLTSRWTHYQPLVRELLAPDLDARQLAYVADEFVLDESTWVSPTDFHWNRAGHEEFARFLYGIIQQRNLLPRLELEAWPEADAAVERLDGGGLADARRRGRLAKRIERLEMHRTLDFEALDADGARQVYGGVDGRDAAPYVSLVLPGPGTGELVLRGERLEWPGLEGDAHVWCEEFELGTFALGGGGAIEARFELPAALAEREFLNVRVESDDYGYELSTVSACVAFTLRSIGIE